jgi:hypothetical protein
VDRATLGLSQFGLILMLTAFYVILGCFLDGISMVVLTMGVIMPTVQKAGIDPLWFGIFIVIVVEMAQVTPAGGLQPVRAAGHDAARDRLHREDRLPVLPADGSDGGALYVFPKLVTFLRSRCAR